MLVTMSPDLCMVVGGAPNKSYSEGAGSLWGNNSDFSIPFAFHSCPLENQVPGASSVSAPFLRQCGVVLSMHSEFGVLNPETGFKALIQYI